MMDKQIIIDGVDVSGCIHCKNKSCIADYCLTDVPFDEAKCELNPNCYYKQLKRKEQECERLSKGYAELTEIVSPYMDDFTGYNEELGGFDIVLCVKELLQQLQAKEQECERWKKANDDKNELLAKLGCPTTATARRQVFTLQQQIDQLKADNEELKKTIMYKCPQCGEEYLSPIGASLYEENNKFKQTLAEIKEIAEWHTTSNDSEDVQEDMKQILQKISECGVEDGRQADNN